MVACGYLFLFFRVPETFPVPWFSRAPTHFWSTVTSHPLHLPYLGTESSPRSDFSGLQRTVMTELRPWSHEAVTCVDLKEKRAQLGLKHKKQQTLTLHLSLTLIGVCKKSIKNLTIWSYIQINKNVLHLYQLGGTQ